MNKYWIVSLLSLVTIIFTGSVAHATYDSEITYGPYLQRVTKKAATVLIATDADKILTLHYKKDGGKWKTSTERAATATHRFRVSNLIKGQIYSYYLSDGGTRLSRTYQFRTQKIIKKNDPLKVGVVGDSGLLNTEALQVALRMRNWEPDIITHTGDIAYYSGTSDNYIERFFPVYQALIAESPFYGSIGNHDYVTDSAGPYKEIFETPTNSGTEEYYSFNYDNVHFVSLNTDLDFTVGSTMYNWFESDLQNAKKRWKIVFFHKPPYSSGVYGNNNDLIDNLVPLLEANDVDLVLNGHEHSYERTKEINGVTYIITGGGGNDLRGQDNDDANTAVFESVYHFVGLTIRKNYIKLQAIDSNGYIFDTATIRP